MQANHREEQGASGRMDGIKNCAYSYQFNEFKKGIKNAFSSDCSADLQYCKLRLCCETVEQLNNAIAPKEVRVVTYRSLKC